MKEFEISLADLHFHAHHGVFSQENKVGNDFSVTLTVRIPFSENVMDDDLSATISYAELYGIVEEEMNHPRKLLMTRLEKEKENGNWVGHIVEALNGEIPEHLYVRGWWDELEREEDCICFQLESAWEPIYEAWDFICSKYEALSAYFIGEESGCEVYLKRDHPDKGWFTDNYYVDICTPKEEYFHEYFKNIDDAFRYIEKIADTNIITCEDIEGLNSAWTEEYPDAYIYLHEFQEV